MMESLLATSFLHPTSCPNMEGPQPAQHLAYPHLKRYLPFMGDAAQPIFLQLALTMLDFHPKHCMYSGAAAGLAHGAYEEALGGCFITYTDITSASGVDLVWDLQKEPPIEHHDAFDLFISTSVLEHVQRPWLAARNMETVVKPGGYLYISVPWVWRYHRYPDDYWRFSASSLDVLFEGSTTVASAWSTSPDCIFYDADPCLDQAFSVLLKGTQDGQDTVRKMLPYLELHQLRRMED